MTTLTLFLIPLNKIVEIKYTYRFLNQPMAQNILWRVTNLFIYQILGGRWMFFIEKGIGKEGKNTLKIK